MAEFSGTLLVPADEIDRLREWGRKQADDIMTLGQEVGRLQAALAQISVVCNDNSEPPCNHLMALDFVRQIADRSSLPSAPADKEQR